MQPSLVFLVVGAVAFGLSAVFTKLCPFPAQVIASGRMILAGLILLPLAIRAWPRRPSPARLLAVALPGILLALHFQLWVVGIKGTTAAAGTFLFAVNPVLFAAVERLAYRRTLPRGTVPCLGAILAGGVWLFQVSGGGGTLTGNLLCLAATLVFVVYLLVSERVAPAVPSGLYLPLVYLWGGILTLPVMLLSGAAAAAPWTEPRAWLWLLALALVPTLLGHASLMVGVRHHSPLVVSFFTLFEPVGATLFAALFLGELPAVIEIPSYALFLVATVVFLWLRFARAPSSPPVQ